LSKLIKLLVIVFITVSSLHAKKDEVDFISLATLMLKDGYYDRASEALNQVDTNQSEFDFAMFYTLKGLVLTKQQRLKVANNFFKKSIENGQEDKSIYLYMAQNSYKLKEYKNTIEYIDSAKDITVDKPKIHSLKADSYWKLKDYDNSLLTLKTINRIFPKFYAAYKQRFYYYVELKLYKSALEDADIYIANAKPNEQTTLSLISALRNAKQVNRAIELAEKSNIIFSKSAKITLLLGHLYLEKQMLQATADIFDVASIKDYKYTKEASEMLRRAKEYSQSLFKNSQMLDTKEKLKQKIAIFLEFSEFERIVATLKDLKRSKLIENEDIRYALANSYYQINDYEECENHLKKLKRTDLFSKATELRKNMQKCKTNFWECQ